MQQLTLLISFLLLTTIGANAQYYAIDTIREVRLTFEQENWEEILTTLKKRGKKERLTATATLDGMPFDSVGVRYKGNSSYHNTQKTEGRKLPFNIKLAYKDKTQTTSDDYKTLKLSNVFRDPSYVREALSYEIARKYMPASACNFVTLYINEEYWGLYNSTQSVDGKFLKEYYGDKNGTFLKCDPEWGWKKKDQCASTEFASLSYIGEDSLCYEGFYELKSKMGWAEFTHLLKAIDEMPDTLEQILDVNQTLWMLAFNNLLVNLDSYTGRLSHNYYLYQNASGQFHPIIWDLNLSFGGFRFSGIGTTMSNEAMQRMSSMLHYKQKNEKRPLITNLLSNSLYRKIYVAQLKTMLEENFQNAWYKERAEAMQDLIAEHVQTDEKRLYPFESMRANLAETQPAGNSKIIGVTELMEARTAYLSNHPLFKRPSPEVKKVAHEVVQDSVTIRVTTDAIEQAWLLYRTAEHGIFKRVAMPIAGEYESDVKKELLWEYPLPKTESLQYYILAEGAKAVTLSPARAAMEFYDLNSKE
ncbi:MAG: CotH kinase family protein [Bacteroidota bacterium]